MTDYRISYDQAIGVWTYLATGVTLTTYTVTGLTAGLNYQFKIESHNSFGYSSYST